GRTGLTRGSLAAFDAEGMVDAVQRSIPAPAIEIVVYCAARGQILGDCAPLAAGAEDVHQAVDHLAQVDRALIATRFGRRDQRSDLRPFFIGQVTLIAQPAAVIAGAVLLGPHGMPPKIDAGAGNGNGISGFKTNPLTDSNDSVCSRTDTQARDGVTKPPHSLFGANPNAPVCAQPVAVLVGVIAVARARITVDIGAIMPVAVSPGPVGIA